MSRPRRLASLLLGAVLVPLTFALAPARLFAAPFTDVGGPSGTGDTTDDVGVAWGDYDSDGDLDLYLSKDNSPNKLYRNNGNGTFTNVGGASGTANNGVGRGVAWGDYDNDSDLDLHLANEGPNRLYRNNGDGTFAEVGGASGTADGGIGRGAAWGDYDNDGFLDLYLANNGVNRLYHNDWNGTFTDVGALSGTADAGNGVGVAWADYDSDGDLDLYLANDNGTNRLFRNNGNGAFPEVAAAAGCSDTGRSSGVAWGDYDNDGDLDLYVAKYGMANRLFRNNGDGTFSNVAVASGIADAGNSTGVAWGDYDNDGDLDLYVVNVGTANRHYRNNGNGTFTDVASSMGTNNIGNGQGVAWADYDNDGDLDLYLANVLGANRLYRNDTAAPAGNHWLHVNLVGGVSNRSGIGARVRCVAGGTSRVCEISGGSGYLSQNSLTAEFGLGTTAAVDTVVVHWPSGMVQRLAAPAIDQRVTVTEPTLFTDVGVPSGVGGGGPNGTGAAWGDYDSDGDLDLYLSSGYSSNGTNRLHRNNGNGTFTEVGAASGTNDTGRSFGSVWGDYDNDGDLDLYVPKYNAASRLYRNNADGTFTDVAGASGTAGPTNALSATWGDYDDDGFIDLYVTNEGPNLLYHNNGNGTFTEASQAAGVYMFGACVGANWVDFNNDGYLDLYVYLYDDTPNLHNRLFSNNGNGTFTDVSASSGTSATEFCEAADWGDYDNDGDLDFFLTREFYGDLLYTNNGNGTFTSSPWNSSDELTYDAAWGDYDNDGDLDLYVVSFFGISRLYRNNGNGTFTDYAAATGTNLTGEGIASAWSDYDADGDLDLYAVDHGSGPNRLYRNDGAVAPGRHWLHVNLIGTHSNRSGIGARVRCIARGTSQIREISAGGRSQCSLTAEFGIGGIAAVDTIVVYWPSGIVQSVANPGIDQRVTITEIGPVAVPEDAPVPGHYALYDNLPNPFNPTTVIRFDLPAAGDVNLTVFDVAGRPVRRLVDGARYESGQQHVTWNGRSDQSIPVASGIYFYRLETNGFRATKRMTLLK